MPADDRIALDAIRWRLRVPDMGDGDWSQFTAWLEADPRHAAIYDAVAQVEAEVGQILPRLPRARAAAPAAEAVPVSVVEPPRRRVSGWASLAAGFVALVGIGVGAYFWPATAEDRIVTTRAGERRLIRLADGTRVALNGASRLAIAGDGSRRVRLEAGEAAFEVVHDAGQPFEVVAGTAVLRDVGTFFDVTHRGDGIEIAVGEGSVAYDPDTSNVVLGAGQVARLSGKPAVLQIAEVDRAAVGAWRSGQLVYRDVPLARVATDLGRSVGWPVTLDDDLAARRFSGTILVDRDRARMRARLAGLLSVAVVERGGGWRLSAEPHAAP